MALECMDFAAQCILQVIVGRSPYFAVDAVTVAECAVAILKILRVAGFQDFLIRVCQHMESQSFRGHVAVDLAAQMKRSFIGKYFVVRLVPCA